MHLEIYKTGELVAVSPRLLITWCERRDRSVYYFDGCTLVNKSVGATHLPAICFAHFDAHCYMYSDARWAQSLQVRELRPLPEKVLPCLKQNKLPAWDTCEQFTWGLKPWFSIITT